MLDLFVSIFKVIPATLLIVGGFIDQPLSWLGGLGHEGGVIDEPIHVVSGHRYSSIKVDLPLTTRSLWYAAGDEPQRNGSIDEGESFFRISDFGDTSNLDGHESGEDCFQNKMRP